MTLLIYRIRGFFRGRRAIALLVIAGGALIGLSLYFASRSTSHFASEFSQYETLAQAQETAAYLPASPENDIRKQLNLDLSLALEDKTTAQERFSYAEDGLRQLSALNAEVDAIGDAGEKADVLIAQMQIDSLKDFATSGQTRELIALAKQRSGIVEDIRGLSYRANFDTENIFKHLIDDKGVLSPDYVEELNNDIPAVEAQFDHRSSLYDQLKEIGNEIDQKAAAMHIAPGT